MVLKSEQFLAHGFSFEDTETEHQMIATYEWVYDHVGFEIFDESIESEDDDLSGGFVDNTIQGVTFPIDLAQQIHDFIKNPIPGTKTVIGWASRPQYDEEPSTLTIKTISSETVIFDINGNKLQMIRSHLLRFFDTVMPVALAKK